MKKETKMKNSNKQEIKLGFYAGLYFVEIVEPNKDEWTHTSFDTFKEAVEFINKLQSN